MFSGQFLNSMKGKQFCKVVAYLYWVSLALLINGALVPTINYVWLRTMNPWAVGNTGSKIRSLHRNLTETTICIMN